MRINKATLIRSAIALAVIATVAIAGILVTFKIADSQKEDYFNQRKIQATTAAAALDSHDIEQLTGKASDFDTPAYNRLRAQLVRIKNSDPRVRFVYIMRPAGDKMIFLVDAEDPSSPDYSPPGQVYNEARETDFAVFKGKRKADTWIEGPIHDRWGTWISANSYILDQTGKPIALLGTDVDVERALDASSQTRHLGIVFDALAVALMVLVALQYLLWLRNRDKHAALRTEMEQSAVRLNDELVKADRMKSDFLQLASHELRGPVNAVNVAVQALDQTAGPRLSDDEKTLVQVAKNGSGRLVDLVDNLLDMTCIEAGDFVIKPKDVVVSELVSSTVQLLEAIAKKKQIGLTAKLPNDPVEARLDPQTVLRVLENLLTNAIKFTDFGGVVVELKATPDKVLLSVQDTGPGIPASFRDELFEKFTKLDRPNEERRQGAGMGLAVCKSMIEAQAGRIWFESQEGKGATFHVELPRYQEPARDDSTE